MKKGASSKKREDSLAMQFLLHAFIGASKAVIQLEELYEEIETQSFTSAQLKKFPGRLRSCINALAGSGAGSFILWGNEKGTLQKLIQHSEGELRKRAVRALKAAEEISSLNNTFSETEMDRFREFFSIKLDALLENMEKLSQELPRLIGRYKHCENVIFFLLRHKDDFDLIYWDNFTKEMLERSFGSSDKARSFLTARYEKRGFNQILPVIAVKMDGIA